MLSSGTTPSLNSKRSHLLNRFALQALNLNPNAIHIWSYLRIAFSCMERFDLVTKCEGRDVNAFKDEFSLFDL